MYITTVLHYQLADANKHGGTADLVLVSRGRENKRTRGTIKSLTNMTGGLPSRKGAMMPPPNAIRYVMTSDSAQKR